MNFSVTLHVSVWVEIRRPCRLPAWYPSRSTWACELKLSIISLPTVTRTSRSTWACELKCTDPYKSKKLYTSRSTWACELKSALFTASHIALQVTLHVSVWVEIRWFLKSTVQGCCHAPRERVSWNFLVSVTRLFLSSHAPRERVSWNL